MRKKKVLVEDSLWINRIKRLCIGHNTNLRFDIEKKDYQATHDYIKQPKRKNYEQES